MWAKDDGIYLGYRAGKIEGEPPALSHPPYRYTGDRHLITIGPNGSGKSHRVLRPNLVLLKSWSVVVVDPKGELFQKVGELRDPGLKNTLILNPFKVLLDRSDGFNPVSVLDPESEDFPDDALALAEALIRMEGKDPHWAASAQDLVAALIMYSRLSNRRGGSLAHVREILGRPMKGLKKTIQQLMVIATNRNCPELATKGGRFVDLRNVSTTLIHPGSEFKLGCCPSIERLSAGQDCRLFAPALADRRLNRRRAWARMALRNETQWKPTHET